MPQRMKTILTPQVATGSEDDLQRQLKLARRAIGRLDLPSARIGGRSREDLRVGREELERWMVQDVESFGPELHDESLRRPKILDEGVVQIPEIRTDDCVSAGISVRANRLQREAAGVEPRVQCLEA